MTKAFLELLFEEKKLILIVLISTDFRDSPNRKKEQMFVFREKFVVHHCRNAREIDEYQAI